MTLRIKSILFLLFTTLFQYCALNDENMILKKDAVIYTIKVNDGTKLVTFSPYDKETQVIDCPVDDLFDLFLHDNKIIIFSGNLTNEYYLTDPGSGKTVIKSLNNKTPYQVFSILDCTSDKIIYTNYKNIYIDHTDNSKIIDSINIGATQFGKVSCSNNDIIAILFNDSTLSKSKDDTFFSFQLTYNPNSFIIYSLKNKTYVKPNYIPQMLGDWSPNGKYLICLDSISVRLLEYPSLKNRILQGFDETKIEYNSLFFMNDTTIVFNGKSEADPEYQIYTYDIKGDTVLNKIIHDDYEKTIRDVFHYSKSLNKE